VNEGADFASFVIKGAADGGDLVARVVDAEKGKWEDVATIKVFTTDDTAEGGGVFGVEVKGRGNR